MHQEVQSSSSYCVEFVASCLAWLRWTGRTEPLEDVITTKTPQEEECGNRGCNENRRQEDEERDSHAKHGDREGYEYGDEEGCDKGEDENGD